MIGRIEKIASSVFACLSLIISLCLCNKVPYYIGFEVCEQINYTGCLKKKVIQIWHAIERYLLGV
jgi:hypothetical protein